MYKAPFSALVFKVAPVFLAGAIALSAKVAAQGHRVDFPAAYTVTDISRAGNGVELTLTIRLRNYSGHDIEDSKILLNSGRPFAGTIGSFGRIKLLRSYGEVSVRQKFVISQDELERWQMGAQPEFELLVPESDGGVRVEQIEARRELSPANPAE